MNRHQWGFSFYDFANSAYVLIFATLLFPIFFREQVVGDASQADFLWGLLLSGAVGLAVALSPFLGHLADRSSRKAVLTALVGVAGLLMLALGLFTDLRVSIYAAIFFLAHGLYTATVAIYDSFLSHVSSAGEREHTSAFAWGFGYAGGVICFAIIYFLTRGDLSGTALPFIITGLFYLIFSAVSLWLLPRGGQPHRLSLGTVAKRLLDGRLGLLLLSFWLINEGIITVTYFTALFGRVTLDLDIKTIGLLFLFVQVLAFPATWLMGRIARKYGVVPTILTTVLVWCIVVIGLMMAQTVVHLSLLSVVSAFVIGSTQALMRSYYADSYPEQTAGFSFGLYAVATRTAALLGPFVFGLVSSGTGSQRIALLTALVPLVIGGSVFWWLSQAEGLSSRKASDV